MLTDFMMQHGTPLFLLLVTCFPGPEFIRRCIARDQNLEHKDAQQMQV